MVSLTTLLVGCGDGGGSGVDGSVDGAGFDAAADATDVDILAALTALEGVSDVVEHPSEHAGYRYFTLMFEQPVDHDQPEGQRFRQFLGLHHRDVGAPMILATTGYANYYGDHLAEPTQMLRANQLTVEHRFFADSRPDPADWDLLRIRQAAGDHHRIAEAFAGLYPAAWLSTGASKGGMTSIYHRRFYPDDVDGTIAYVAPISFGAPDDRYQPFFDTVGTADCRARLHAYQRELLLRRAAMESRAADEAADEGYTFEYVGGLEVAFESEVSGFEWGFWQYMGITYCDYLPATTDSDDTLYQFFAWLGGVGNSDDANILWFMPYYFQSEVELGYPGYHADYLDDLVIYADVPFGDVYPEGFDRTYDPAAMVDIADWVAGEGSQLIFVYGAFDPWTAGAFDLGDAVDSLKLTVPGGNHGAGLADLPPSDLAPALAALEAWTGVTPVVARAARPAAPPRYLPAFLRRPR